MLCQESQPLLAALLGGAVGGVMRGCVEPPAELLKTRLQVGAGLGSASLLLRGLRSTCMPGWHKLVSLAERAERAEPTWPGCRACGS